MISYFDNDGYVQGEHEGVVPTALFLLHFIENSLFKLILKYWDRHYS
mgnify:FL=1